MRRLNVSQDIVPIGEFKTHASEFVRQIHKTRRPLVITQNGRPTAVMITPDEFEDLGYREFVRAKIQAGIDSAATERTYTVEEVKERLLERIRATAKKKKSR